jgi:hypothetical protein
MPPCDIADGVIYIVIFSSRHIRRTNDAKCPTKRENGP